MFRFFLIDAYLDQTVQLRLTSPRVCSPRARTRTPRLLHNVGAYATRCISPRRARRPAASGAARAGR